MDYSNDLEDSDDEGGPRTMSAAEELTDQKRQQTAKDFFDTIFGSRDEFLAALSINPVNTGEFKSWCELKCQEAMEKNGSNGQESIRFCKDSPKDLLRELRPFLENNPNQACLWPIVDCVTIRFNSPLLEQGIELIDLPGKFLKEKYDSIH